MTRNYSKVKFKNCLGWHRVENFVEDFKLPKLATKKKGCLAC